MATSRTSCSGGAGGCARIGRVEYLIFSTASIGHNAIGFVTPDERHRGRDVLILAKCDELYKAARVCHPERWSGNTRNWTPAQRAAPESDQEGSDHLSATWLATVPPTACIVGKLYEVRYLGTLFGVALFTHQIGAFLGAWLGGLAV